MEEFSKKTSAERKQGRTAGKGHVWMPFIVVGDQQAWLGLQRKGLEFCTAEVKVPSDTVAYVITRHDG